MQYAISQLVLDVFGDLLSKSRIMSITKVLTHFGRSPVHSASAHLASEAPTGSKICIGLFSVPHRCRGHLHCYTSEWSRMARQT